MSDHPPQPPPPPPPDNLNPPPGFAAYSSTPWAAVRLKRVGGLAKTIMILLGVVSAGYLIDLALIGRRVDIAEEFLRDGDEDAFTSDYFGASVGGTLAGLATLAVVVTSIIWIYRVVGNHRALGRHTSWSPGFAIGGWFLPPVLYVIPLLILRENWKASDPSVPPGSEDWRRTQESPLPWIWFVIYSLVPLGLAIAGASFAVGNFASDPEDLAENIIDTQGITIAQYVVSILAAVVWALLVRNLTARHRELSGEARAR